VRARRAPIRPSATFASTISALTPQPASQGRCAEGDRFPSFRDLRQQPVSGLAERAAFVGQAQAPRPALDQPHAKALLELGSTARVSPWTGRRRG